METSFVIATASVGLRSVHNKLDYCNSPQSSVGRIHFNPELIVFKHDPDGPILARHFEQLPSAPLNHTESKRPADLHSIHQRCTRNVRLCTNE